MAQSACPRACSTSWLTLACMGNHRSEDMTVQDLAPIHPYSPYPTSLENLCAGGERMLPVAGCC